MFGSVLTYPASLRLLWGLALLFTIWGVFSPTVSSVRLWYGYMKAIAFCVLLSHQVCSLSSVCPLSLCVFLGNNDSTCQQDMLCFFPALPALSPALVWWHWLINLCNIMCSDDISIPQTLSPSQNLWHRCLSNSWVFWGDHFIENHHWVLTRQKQGFWGMGRATRGRQDEDLCVLHMPSVPPLFIGHIEATASHKGVFHSISCGQEVTYWILTLA